MNKIDWTKPIRLKSGNANRAVKVQHVTPDGFAIVDNDYDRPSSMRLAGWVMFKPDGTYHIGETNTAGSALEVENVPEDKKLYLRLSTFTGPEQTSVDNQPIKGTGVACVELTLKDGIVTDASLHRANRDPITHFTPIHSDKPKEI